MVPQKVLVSKISVQQYYEFHRRYFIKILFVTGLSFNMMGILLSVTDFLMLTFEKPAVVSTCNWTANLGFFDNLKYFYHI